MLGVTIGTTHCSELGLILKSVKNPFPTVKRVTVDVAGMDGIVDVTDYFGIRYNNRTVTLNFAFTGGYQKRYSVQTKFADLFHGKNEKITLDEEKGCYYVGRLSAVEWINTSSSAEMQVTIDCEPFKYEATDSTEPWKWDPFNFETGAIMEYSKINVPSKQISVKLAGTRKPVSPIFKTDGVDMRVIYNGVTYNLTKGVEKTIYEIIIGEEGITVDLLGTGNVSIKYRRGHL